MPHHLLRFRLLLTFYLLLLLLGCTSQSPTTIVLSLDTSLPRTNEQVTLLADVDSAEEVWRVSFYAGTELLGSDALAPFQSAWTASAGSHTLRAVAEGDTGTLAEASMNVQVGEGDGRTPLASFVSDPVDGSGAAPLNISFDATGTTDPDNDVSELNYAWDFGDGNTDSGVSATHTYAQTGEYQVVLTVTDPDGNKDTASFTVSVSTPAPAPTNQIALPLEVYGNDGYTQKVTFRLDNADVNRLYLQTHRLAYRDASVNEARGAKGSVRLNSGEWLDLYNGNEGLKCYAHEAAYGCLNSAYHTVRFTLPISGAIKGENTLEFRFNGTDGFSNGYRVLGFNLRKGRMGKDALAKSSFTSDDKAELKTPLTKQSDIDKGKDLWKSKVLRESPLDEAELRAKCSDCHAQDGRDLKYFNYSNTSIIERSKFHGLSELEGKQIASYIRNLDVPAPSQARPWNPPYQPGPELDNKPVQDWAAGAGLDWVLEEDADMLEYLFPKGTSQAEIDEALSLKATLNMRELPMALQLPDWNAWLPEVHPKDLWADFEASKAFERYVETEQAFANDLQVIIEDKSLPEVNTAFRKGVNSFAGIARGPQPCVNYYKGNRSSAALDRLPTGKTCEDGLMSLNQWHAVKQWELFQVYGVESLSPSAFFPYGEARGWLGDERGVFDVAAHRSADNSSYFKHQSKAAGAYHSNAWYHTQLILNSGFRDRETFQPQDWFYTGNWLAISARENGVNLSAFFTATHLKMLQNLDLSGPDGKGEDTLAGYDIETAENKVGWWIQFVHPWRLEGRLHSGDGEPLIGLDNYESGLRTKVANALLSEWLDKTTSYKVSDLPRQTDVEAAGGDFYEHKDYVLDTAIPDVNVNCFYSCPGQGYHARDFYRLMHRLRAMKVDASLRNEMIDWLKEVWPENDWDVLR